jgi:hypothetical protein
MSLLDGRVPLETGSSHIESQFNLANIPDYREVLKHTVATEQHVSLIQFINEDLFSVFLRYEYSKPQAYILTANFAGYNIPA